MLGETPKNVEKMDAPRASDRRSSKCLIPILLPFKLQILTNVYLISTIATLSLIARTLVAHFPVDARQVTKGTEHTALVRLNAQFPPVFAPVICIFILPSPSSFS